MTIRALLVLVTLLAGACANEAFIDEVERSASGSISVGGRLGTTNLETGDCFNERSGSVVRSVDAVPCDEPHRGQVVARVPAEPHDGWPGVTALTEEAGLRCTGLAEEFLASGVDQFPGLPQVDLAAYVPDESAWEDGDRSILCWVELAEPVVFDFRPAIGA